VSRRNLKRSRARGLRILGYASVCLKFFGERGGGVAGSEVRGEVRVGR
jgi:hypothetical protein